MKTTALNDSNFDSTINSSDKPVLVDFYADWCGPCKMLEPIIDEVAAEQGDKAVVAKVNIEDSPGVASRYGITTIPALVVFKGGKRVTDSRGVQSKGSIHKLINSAA